MSDAANDAMAEGFARDDEPGFEVVTQAFLNAMTTEEKLNAIVAKCRALDNPLNQVMSPSSIAGWRSTIAAIEFIHRGRFELSSLVRDILAAWPEELLQTTEKP